MERSKKKKHAGARAGGIALEGERGGGGRGAGGVMWRNPTAELSVIAQRAAAAALAERLVSEAAAGRGLKLLVYATLSYQCMQP
jgi:hypothetical protein